MLRLRQVATRHPPTSAELRGPLQLLLLITARDHHARLWRSLVTTARAKGLQPATATRSTPPRRRQWGHVCGSSLHKLARERQVDMRYLDEVIGDLVGLNHLGHLDDIEALLPLPGL